MSWLGTMGNDELPDAVQVIINTRIDGGDDPDTDYGDEVIWEAAS